MSLNPQLAPRFLIKEGAAARLISRGWKDSPELLSYLGSVIGGSVVGGSGGSGGS